MPPSNLEKVVRGTAWALEEQDNDVGTPFLPPPPSLTSTHEEAETSGNQKYTGVPGGWTDRWTMGEH